MINARKTPLFRTRPHTPKVWRRLLGDQPLATWQPQLSRAYHINLLVSKPIVLRKLESVPVVSVTIPTPVAKKSTPSKANQKKKKPSVDTVISATPMASKPMPPVPPVPKRAGSRTVKEVLRWLAAPVVLAAMGVAAVVYGPPAYYRFFPALNIAVPTAETRSSWGTAYAEGPTQPTYTPPQDQTLPQGEWIVIPRIEVRTQLRATDNPDEALAKGVWLMPEYGKPGDRQQPMVVAAHRYGFTNWWQDDYWKYNSFYRLTELEPGDMIEVIADQRRWRYEIYAGEEGPEITDYRADLILYTCKYVNSPVRHIRYARLLDPTVDTQQVTQVVPVRD